MYQMTKIIVLASVVLGLNVLMMSSQARAGVISTLSQPSRCLCAPNGLGQSFTAEDEFVLLTIEAGDANTHLFPGSWSIDITFLAGDGPSGPVLESFRISDIGFGKREFTFDLTHIPLTIGNQYSFVLNSDGGRGVTGRTSSDVYAGGRAFRSDTGASFGELGFAVTPTAPPPPPPPSPVPAPGALALLGLGLIGLGARRRAA